MASWNDLQRTKRRDVSERDLNDDEFADLCALVFTTPNGQRLLDHLHSRYIDAVAQGTLTESALRESHAKRQVVRELEAKTSLGVANLKVKKGKDAAVR
jgi:hypothetical protein